jgi:hypothetical protein
MKKIVYLLVLVAYQISSCGPAQLFDPAPTPTPTSMPTPAPTLIPGIDEFIWINGVELKVISITVQDEYAGLRAKNVNSNLVIIYIEFGEGDVHDRIWDKEMYLAYEFDIYKNQASLPEVVEGGKFAGKTDYSHRYFFATPKGSTDYILHFTDGVKVPLSSLEE